MSTLAPTLNMMLGWAGEVDWKFPEFSGSEIPQRPIVLSLSQLEEKLGSPIKIPHLEGVKIYKSGWLDKLSTYYGDFSEGSIIGFNYDSPIYRFSIIQRRILKSNGPKMFIYPKQVIRAYQKQINNGLATIVLAPEKYDDLASFATVVWEDIVLEVTFYWRVDETTIEKILFSIM